VVAGTWPVPLLFWAIPESQCTGDLPLQDNQQPLELFVQVSILFDVVYVS
jgi:hypothetical protein